MKITKGEWVGIIFGGLMLVADVILYFVGGRDTNLFVFIAGIIVAVMVLPFVMEVVTAGKREQQINEMFLEFSRSLSESVATGTPVSKSIINMRSKNYGPLSPHVEKLANQIEIGIPLNKALQSFARDVDNPVITRAVALISEAEKAGGQIGYILESVAKSMSEVEKLKKERKAAIYNLVVQGYVIFIIFIGIMLIMKFKILPITSEIGSSGNIGGALSSGAGGGAAAPAFTVDELSRPFLYLLLAQGFFAGLTIGKLAEGSVRDGIKHSFILMMLSFLIYSGANAFIH